ncbi:hypothetical protein EDD18DRAFT_1099171 [Armillaria luteobubalina]|uniref:Rho termination factor-like N-terminal domain-containing protein n=1 Tax=Armillaria luteobubalina TaxID=153913 RepID=A0AA39QL75_9AGAR|nr:hypothetical protein EDD18DRAFT_1099171 [Armillaria luteobubalina]
MYASKKTDSTAVRKDNTCLLDHRMSPLEFHSYRSDPHMSAWTLEIAVLSCRGKSRDSTGLRNSQSRPWQASMQIIFTQEALKKLVVAQLKAICKERQLTGVSKLTKALLIQKILDHQGKQPAQETSDVDAAPTLSSQPKAASALLSRDVSMLSGPSIPTQPSQSSLPLSLNLSLTSQSQSQTQPPKAELPRRLVTQSKAPPNKIASDAETMSTATNVPKKSSLPAKAIPNLSRLHPDSVSGALAQPLTKKRPAPNEANQKSKKQRLPPKPIPFLFPPKSTAVSKENVRKPTKDFPPISLNNITLPPSMAQRRLVARIAIILSQSQRMFRYAVYLSASQRILRGFPGRRFALLLEAYPQNMTNMWPYLRLRNQEAVQRRGIYEASFLARVFERNDMIISPKLWTSPDHEHQAKIAIRFLLTRLFFRVSVGENTRDWMAGTVVDAQQVVEGEIWCITMQHRAMRESFYVLEATCEVVGHPPGSQLDVSLPIRADWSAYVERRSTLHEKSPPTMMEHVCWTNHEEYDRGISRHWLKRMRREGKVGAMLEAIAGRYVLACVVGNSGTPRLIVQCERAVEVLLGDGPGFFRHHHVESVHVRTAGGESLHPALAVVQTPGREYFVLRDNGMQVGCEEEGVGEVWMGLLGCDGSGRVC